MLKATDTAKAPMGMLTVDWYIPFTFKTFEGVLSSPTYWFIRDLPYGLVELKLERDRHVVREVIIVGAGKRVLAALPDVYTTVRRATGLPVIDLPPEHPRTYEDERSLYVVQQEEAVYVLWDVDSAPTDCLEFDRVRFFLREGALCGLGFMSLTSEELGMLADSGRLPGSDPEPH